MTTRAPFTARTHDATRRAPARASRLVAHHALVVALAAVATLVACAKSVGDLAPFPCAKDGSCPASLTCVSGMCTAGALVDQACHGQADCTGGDCLGGKCLARCGNSNEGDPCDERHVCTYPLGSESLAGAHCVLDCVTAPCPDGLVCTGLYSGRKGCVAPEAAAGEGRPCGTPQECAAPMPYTCSRGVCAKTCAVGACESGYVCNATSPIYYSGCLLDCTTTASCPAPLTCAALANAPGTKACVNATLP